MNALGWAPHSSGHLGSVGNFLFEFFILFLADDGQALIWDVSQASKQKIIQEPILAYSAESEVNQFSWSTTNPEWVSIAFGNTCQALRV
jgi:WD repeat-containing protein 68